MYPRNVLKKISFILIIFSFNWATSNESANCPDLYQSKGQIQVQQLKTADGFCLLSIVPKKAYVDLIYRSYVFSDKGSLFVFNSFGDGDNENELTGAKEFYFFPRMMKDQIFSWINDSKNEYLNIQTNHYFNMLIDTETGLISAVDKAEAQIDPEIRPDNEGGVRIKPKAGLIYELPFTKGQAPSSRPNTRGVFTDANGQKCTVKVSELFSKDSSGEVYLKMTDYALKQFLMIKCPKLNVGY